MQGVLYPKLEMKAHTIKRPECFSPYNGNWAVQLGNYIGDQLPAQILIGDDCTCIFPVCVETRCIPVQMRNCRLMRSVLTGRYLMFGLSNKNDELYAFEFPQTYDSNLARAALIEAQINNFEQAFLDNIITI